MASLKGSKTEDNLKAAFAGESQSEPALSLFRAEGRRWRLQRRLRRFPLSTAEGETGHAHGHLEYLEESGDPATRAAGSARRSKTI